MTLTSSHFYSVYQGLRISKYYGNFQQQSPTDLALGVLDSDKAVSALIQHSRSLDERQYAYIQCAVLYTSVDGKRRVRMCNLALQVVSLAGNVFRCADMDAVVCHFARDCESLMPVLSLVVKRFWIAMADLSLHRMAQIREDLTDKCSSILLGYRRNCAAATTHTQVSESRHGSCAPLRRCLADNTGSLPSASALRLGDNQVQTIKGFVFVAVDGTLTHDCA